jgi:FKBP-type peptidyl-prolyl cis-trans isomerase FkpA
MVRRSSLIAMSMAFACGVAFAAHEDDPVEKRLAAGKDEYEKAAEKARTGLLADLKKKEEASQKAGDLKTLEKVRAEVKSFAEYGELPKSVPVKSYENQIRVARAKLEERYLAAVKDYTKGGMIALAKAAQQELDEFKKGDPITAAGVPRIPQLDSKEWTKKANGLKIWDVKEGTGKAVEAGAAIRVSYIGWLANGKAFEVKRTGGPFEIRLADSIKGWAEGVPGMKVGGVRRLVVPPSLAYGRTGAGKAIPPDATLVFEIELLGIK